MLIITWQRRSSPSISRQSHLYFLRSWFSWLKIDDKLRQSNITCMRGSAKHSAGFHKKMCSMEAKNVKECRLSLQEKKCVYTPLWGVCSAFKHSQHPQRKNMDTPYKGCLLHHWFIKQHSSDNADSGKPCLTPLPISHSSESMLSIFTHAIWFK